jgi:hypothetical protein
MAQGADPITVGCSGRTAWGDVGAFPFTPTRKGSTPERIFHVARYHGMWCPAACPRYSGPHCSHTKGKTMFQTTILHCLLLSVVTSLPAMQSMPQETRGSSSTPFWREEGPRATLLRRALPQRVSQKQVCKLGAPSPRRGAAAPGRKKTKAIAFANQCWRRIPRAGEPRRY